MRNLLKPASRLIAVFIFTMIISGGILSYLSINSISNFRELTEKKVSEEQLSVSYKLSVRFQAFLEDIANDFSAEEWSLVENPFVLDRTGMFLKPWYLEGSKLKDGPLTSSAYEQNFRMAQQNEFRERNLEGALRHYRRSLSRASSSSDSARSYNAIGRIFLKSGNLPQAYHTYSMIASDYSSILDNNGFPYVYYSIHNLIRISAQEDTMDILPVIGSFLQKILQGTIPMNSSTSDILREVSDWTKNYNTQGINPVPDVGYYIRSINRYLRFIEQFSPGIKAALIKWTHQESQLKLGQCLAINDISVDPGKLVILDTSSSELRGCCADVDTLWSAFMQDLQSVQSEFEYNITLLRNGAEEPRSGAKISGSKNELSLSSDLSPYFPASLLIISLKDKNLIDLLVKRRSWSYGIALFLLLGAMLLGILLILRDIARERHLAHLRSDFVSNVSHELKTPLTSIHVFAESILLDRVKSSSDQKEYLKIILKETERLKRMINNILDFSRREKGKVEYQARPVDVTALLKAALSDLNYWLEEMGFKVQTEIEEGVRTSGDPEALKQVVINLLDNAIKYSDKVKEICVRLQKKEKAIRIEVADKGMGISEDQIGHVFDKFYRVNDSQVKGIAGTGLGLTVVKEIVEAHGGEVSVKSDPGKGSVFTIMLNSM